MIKSLKALVMMQLKDKMDLSFARTKKSLISKIVLSVLSFVLITAVIYVLLYVSKIMKIFSLVDAVPISVIIVVFTIMQLLSIIACTFGLMKNLYFAKDNQILLTLPVTRNKIFISKLIVFYIYELIKNLYFIFPLFIAYGLISGLSVVFYFWLVICIVLISMIPVAIGAFLSIFAMGISIFLKNYSIIRWTLFAFILGAGIYLVVFLIGLIPENLDIVGTWGTTFWDIQDFLTWFVNAFYPFSMLTNFIVGFSSGIVYNLFTLSTLYVLLAIIAFVALMLALSFLISRPLFFKMASTPFEYKRKITKKEYKNKFLKAFTSAIKKENFVIFRTSDEVYSLFGLAIAMPILILLLNKIFASMSTRLLGDYMAVSFNLLLILLIAMASNNKIASIFSREGSAGYLIKTRPNNYHQNLTAKLITYAIVVSVSIIASVMIFAFYNSLSVINIILLGLSCVMIYLNHMLWSAEMDIMNPQYNQYATSGNHSSNPNETKSVVAMLFLAFLFFALSLFLSIENINLSWVKVFGIALALLGYRIWSYYNKIKFYYKEK